MDVTQRISSAIVRALEWRLTLPAVAASTVVAGLAIGYVLMPAKRSNDLVPVDVAIAQNAPSRVVANAPMPNQADRGMRVPRGEASTLQASTLQASTLQASALQASALQASTLPVAAVAGAAAWGATLGRMNREDGTGNRLRSGAGPQSANPTPSVAPAAEAKPTPRAAPILQPQKRPRAVHHTQVAPRRYAYRATYRRYPRAPFDPMARTVSRGMRTISRVLTSIAN